jgi:peptidyl-tRNA hydrolase
MNPGKGAAQACHAANLFTADIENHDAYLDAYDEWVRSTAQYFGTTIVLGCTKSQLLNAVQKAFEAQIPTEMITDPTYPYNVIGEVANIIAGVDSYEPRSTVTVTRQEITCGYVFLKGSVIDIKYHKEVLKKLPLHP